MNIVFFLNGMELIQIFFNCSFVSCPNHKKMIYKINIELSSIQQLCVPFFFRPICINLGDNLFHVSNRCVRMHGIFLMYLCVSFFQSYLCGNISSIRKMGTSESSSDYNCHIIVVQLLEYLCILIIGQHILKPLSKQHFFNRN